MSNETTQVAIIMGSDSDLPVVEAIFPILDSFGVKYTKNVMSAHRTPHAVMDLIKNSENNGCKVFIAAAGMAAHLAGAVAAHSTKPVIGIPIESGGMGGIDFSFINRNDASRCSCCDCSCWKKRCKK